LAGKGYKFCGVVGGSMAVLALEGRSRFDLSLFEIRRLLTHS